MIIAVLVLARALHIGSAMILVALPFFMRVALRSAWNGDRRPGQPVLGAQIVTGLWLALTVEAVSGIVWFWLIAAQMNEESPWAVLNAADLGTVLGQTQFGRLWLARAAVGALLGIILFFLACERDRSVITSMGNALFLVFSAGLLVMLAWAGHAGSGARWQAWHLFVDGVHLLAGAVWPLGLVPLAMFLAEARSRGTSMDKADRAVVARYSQCAFVAVLAVVSSGVLNAWLMLPSWGALVTSAYGRLLVAKVLVVVAMIGLGALNRYRFLPALAHQATPRMLRAVVAETVLALVVVLIVGAMGTTAPGN